MDLEETARKLRENEKKLILLTIRYALTCAIAEVSIDAERIISTGEIRDYPCSTGRQFPIWAGEDMAEYGRGFQDGISRCLAVMDYMHDAERVKKMMRALGD